MSPFILQEEEEEEEKEEEEEGAGGGERSDKHCSSRTKATSFLDREADDKRTRCPSRERDSPRPADPRQQMETSAEGWAC